MFFCIIMSVKKKSKLFFSLIINNCNREEKGFKKEGISVDIKEKLRQCIKAVAANSVGKSSPSNIHEPKVPASLKAAKDSQK